MKSLFDGAGLLLPNALHDRLPELIPIVGREPAESQMSRLGVEFSPMTTLTWSLSLLATQYFVMCGLLAALRAVELLLRGSFGGWLARAHQVLERAELTVNAAPMLCILFLAAQMRAMQLSQGLSDPPRWVRTCMCAAVAAFCAHTVLMVVVSLAGDMPEVDEDVAIARTASPCARALSCMSGLVLAAAAAAVCAGIVVMPAEFTGEGEPVSPAVSCTIGLTLLFFAVHLCLVGLGSVFEQLRGPGVTKATRILRLAAQTVFFAPMLCTLFVAARLRALQLSFGHGQPQAWAQGAFYACSVAVGLQTLLAIVVPCLPGGDARCGSTIKGDIEIAVSSCQHSGGARLLFAAVRWLPSMCMFVGVLVIFASMLLVNGPREASRLERPLPPAMRCVLALAAMFFPTLLALRFALNLRDMMREPHLREPPWIKKTVEVLHVASATVRFCPMLAILFLVIRLRAQQITLHRGAPQGWAQDAMYVCTGAVFLQLLCCLLVGVLARRRGDLALKQPAPAVGSQGGRAAFCRCMVVAAQVVLPSVICGGAVVVCVALFLLTPESAHTPGLLAS